jgi:hypothetical protein
MKWRDISYHTGEKIHIISICRPDNYCSHPPLIHHRWAGEARIAANIAKLPVNIDQTAKSKSNAG